MSKAADPAKGSALFELTKKPRGLATPTVREATAKLPTRWPQCLHELSRLAGWLIIACQVVEPLHSPIPLSCIIAKTFQPFSKCPGAYS